MQVRKIDCKLTRQRNQSSSPEKRLISLQFFISDFLRCGNSNKKKKLESGNQDNSNNMSREPPRFCGPLLLHLLTQTARYKTDTLFTVFCYGPLLLRSDNTSTYVRLVCLPIVCVPVSVGLCVMWLSCHLKLSQSHSPAVSRPLPTSSTRPRKVVALVCIRSCVLQRFVKTL